MKTQLDGQKTLHLSIVLFLSLTHLFLQHHYSLIRLFRDYFLSISLSAIARRALGYGGMRQGDKEMKEWGLQT